MVDEVQTIANSSEPQDPAQMLATITQLIKNVEGFGFHRVAEICFFIMSLGSDIETSLITHSHWAVCSLTSTLCNKTLHVKTFTIDAHYKVFVMALWLLKNHSEIKQFHHETDACCGKQLHKAFVYVKTVLEQLCTS